MKIRDLKVEVTFPCDGDPLFISGVWGHCGIAMLEDLETDMAEQFEDDMLVQQRLKLRVTDWTEPEIQYGEDGDSFTLAGYFDWIVLSTEPVAEL